MKRIFVLLAAITLLPGAPRLVAQDASTAAAEREQAEERHRSLTATIVQLQESVAAAQKNVTALREEVRHLKDELDRYKAKNEGAATQDNIKRLAEKIEEVDKKRQADNERTVKYIEARNADLQKMLLDRGGNSGGRTPTPPATPGGT